MSQILRSWLAFAAIGAAVIHLALVVTSPPALGVILVVLGAAEASWGVIVLARDRIVAPRIARAGAVIPMILWSLLVVAATVLSAPVVASSIPFIPMAVATLFELFIAGVLSALLRRDADDFADAPAPAPAESVTSSPTPTLGAGRYLVGLFAGGLLVAMLTTPALSFTLAGSVDPHAAHDGGVVQTTGGGYVFTIPNHAGH